jgi:hypothetical protein
MEFQLIRIKLVNIRIKVYLNLNIRHYYFRRYLLVFLFKSYLIVHEKNGELINFCLMV